MKIHVVEPTRVLVDPHDGSCRGAHNVAIEALPLPMGIQGSVNGGRAHVTLAWNASALLSIGGSQEFFEAGLKACEIARQMARDGEYREQPAADLG